MKFNNSNLNSVVGESPGKLEEVSCSLSINMKVELTVKDETFYGVVKWMGTLSIRGKMVDLVGLEMVRE